MAGSIGLLRSRELAWLLRASGREGVVTGLLTLGEPGVTQAGVLPVQDVDIFVAQDGKLRGVSASGRLDVFDGGVWTVEAVPPREARDVLVAGDGTIWAAWVDSATGTGGGKPEAGLLGLDGREAIASSTSPATFVNRSSSLAVTTDGEVWLGIGFYDEGGKGHWRGVLRAGESGWVVEHPVGDRDDLSAGPMAAGPDGSLWVYLAGGAGGQGRDRYLARRDADGWTHFSADDGVPPLVGTQTNSARLAVAPDGMLWIAFDSDVDVAELRPELGPHAAGDCPGVLSFDGTEWRRYLVGTCINHVAFAGDGAVWATSRTGQSQHIEVPERAGLYVIDPDAATPPAP